MAEKASIESVQCFGRKKTAVAVTYCKRGRGLIKINGCPIELVEPEILRFKAVEPILLLGRQRFAGVDMRIRVKGGGHTSQIYAIRQSIAKALVAFYQKYVDEQSKKEIKDILVRYDRTLLVADPRRCEPKKFGGRGARARFQKSYRKRWRIFVHVKRWILKVFVVHKSVGWFILFLNRKPGNECRYIENLKINKLARGMNHGG
ncbi:hypothetical protein SCA6_006467 [Theobroma cacao]